MADLFENRLATSHKNLAEKYNDRMDVPKERRFLGFDAYRKAIDCLRPGDVALLTTHSAFRATHLEYAVEKGVHVFMEKTFAPDPGGVGRILRLGEAAEKKNLKIAAGVMCRHSSARQALIQKMRDGAMGDIQFIRAYRMDSGYRMGPRDSQENELLWQLRRPYQFFWASSGIFIELMIHQIDECCWIKDAWPVSAHGVGGRAPNRTDCSQNLDTYSIEYTFADGTKALVSGRYIPHCHNDFATFVHGTKCAAQFSGNIHAPTVQLYKDQRIAPANIAWKPEREKVDPGRPSGTCCWRPSAKTARTTKPGGQRSRTSPPSWGGPPCIPGTSSPGTKRRPPTSVLSECGQTGQRQPAPVQADAQGRYPAPIPGAWTEI